MVLCWCFHFAIYYWILWKWCPFLLSVSSVWINPVELTLTMVSFLSFRWSKALKSCLSISFVLICSIGLLTLVNQDDDITALQVQSFSLFIWSLLLIFEDTIVAAYYVGPYYTSKFAFFCYSNPHPPKKYKEKRLALSDITKPHKKN